MVSDCTHFQGQVAQGAHGAGIDGDVFYGQCLETLGLCRKGVGAGRDDIEYARSLRIGFFGHDRTRALVGEGALGPGNRGSGTIHDSGA
jgi:hypothetical protein